MSPPRISGGPADAGTNGGICLRLYSVLEREAETAAAAEGVDSDEEDESESTTVPGNALCNHLPEVERNNKRQAYIKSRTAAIAATHAASGIGPQAVLQGVVDAEEEVLDTEDGALYTEDIDAGGEQDIEELLMHGDEDDEGH